MGDTGNEVKQKTLDTGNKVKRKSANTGGKGKRTASDARSKGRKTASNTAGRGRQASSGPENKSKKKNVKKAQVLKSQKRLKWIQRGLLLISVVLLAALAGTIFWQTEITEFTVLKNNYLSEELITDSLFGSELDRRYFYAWLKNQFGTKKEIPMIEDYNITFEKTNQAVIEVEEKEPVGFIVYVDTYLAFDDEGYLLSSSEEPAEGIPAIEGLSFEKIVLYQQLVPTDEEMFEDALYLMELLDKCEIESDRIIFDSEGKISLRIGDILVSLGERNYMEDKIKELESISEKIEGLKGTLYLDDCTGVGSKKRYIFLPE